MFTILATALAVPTAASAVLFGGTDSDGTVSVKNGIGRLWLSPFTGAAVGRIADGKVVITDPIADDGQGAQAWGCDNGPGGVDVSDTTTVCIGHNLRFRAAGGRYKIGVRGSGIFISAVGRGTLTLNGAGDDPNIDSDGVFSINDSVFRSLPNDPKSFPLAPPAGG